MAVSPCETENAQEEPETFCCVRNQGSLQKPVWPYQNTEGHEGASSVP